MNLRKLLTFTGAATLAVMPVATAQNPTILQGSYVSNVFGQSNFVKNPNAQTNTANVTLTTATATRSTTTPLVATTEWNVTITSANGTAAWATRTFDAGMKNQNCEVRFTYRGFQATSKAQIKQGANVVAELVLTPSATDPRIASINFPCGDLSSATTFVITDTATLAGTNEIGGIYVGLATNQANVAQAEVVVLAVKNSAQSFAHTVKTPVIYNVEELDVYGEFNPSTGQFIAKRSGRYEINASLLLDAATFSATSSVEMYIRKNGVDAFTDRRQVDATVNTYRQAQAIAVVDMNAGDIITAELFQNSGGPRNAFLTTAFNRLSITRFPSSSELVVTPETQNVWGGVYYAGIMNNVTVRAGSPASGTTFQTFSSAQLASARTVKGKCQPALTSNDLGCSIPDMPVGNYRISVRGEFWNQVPTSGANECVNRIYETQTATQIAGNLTGRNFTDAGLLYQASTIEGIFTNTSVGTRNFIVQAAKSYDTTSGNAAYCAVYANTPANGSDITFTIEPLDNNANSALYVQGPLKAAGTGTAIPAGYVGEEKTGYATSTSTVTANVEVNVSGASITLEPGVWELQYSASVLVERTPAGTLGVQCRLRVRDSLGNVESFTESGAGLYSDLSSVAWNFLEMSKTKRLYLTGTKTFNLSITSNQNNTVGNCVAYTGSTTGGITGEEATTYIRAVRVN